MLLPRFPFPLLCYAPKLLLLTIKKPIEEHQMEQTDEDDEQVKKIPAFGSVGLTLLIQWRCSNIYKKAFQVQKLPSSLFMMIQFSCLYIMLFAG